MFKSWSEGTDQPTIHFSRKTFIYRKTYILPWIIRNTDYYRSKKTSALPITHLSWAPFNYLINFMPTSQCLNGSIASSNSLIQSTF